jgi:hypothetical protein
MSQSQPKSLSYSLDYPAELWVTYANPAVAAIAELRKYSLELDDMLANSLNYTWTTTWQTNQNLVRLVIYIEFTEEQLSWMLLKYPKNKRIVNID